MQKIKLISDRSHAINKELVALLEDILECAKTGKITSAAISTSGPKEEGQITAHSYCYMQYDNIFQLIGGMTYLQAKLMSFIEADNLEIYGE